MNHLKEFRFPSLWRTTAIATVLATSIMAMIACGPAAEPQPEEPVATAAPAATSAPAATASVSTSAPTEPAAPAAMLAPTFELPSGTGGTVSLTSFAGDKNVVLVFYRGFW